jgi:hypothetical protein
MKRDIQDTVWHVLSSILGKQRVVDANLKYDPNDGILQSINSSIAETEKMVKNHFGLSTDEIAERLAYIRKESKD